MALIRRYVCSTCGDIPEPEGCGFYARGPNQERHVVGRDLQPASLEAIAGRPLAVAQSEGLVGFIHACLCMRCGAALIIDLERDHKRCPACESLDVRSYDGAVGEICPRCKTGTLRSEAVAIS